MERKDNEEVTEMSVIVKEMAMPSCCDECRFVGEYLGEGNTDVFYCEAHLNIIENPREGRLDTCPLVEISEEKDSVSSHMQT